MYSWLTQDSRENETRSCTLEGIPRECPAMTKYVSAGSDNGSLGVWRRQIQRIMNSARDGLQEGACQAQHRATKGSRKS